MSAFKFFIKSVRSDIKHTCIMTNYSRWLKSRYLDRKRSKKNKIPGNHPLGMVGYSGRPSAELRFGIKTAASNSHAFTAITLDISGGLLVNSDIFSSRWIIVSHCIVKEMSISLMKLRVKRSQFYLLGRKYHSVSKLQIPLVDHKLHTYLFGEKEAEISESKARDPLQLKL